MPLQNLNHFRLMSQSIRAQAAIKIIAIGSLAFVLTMSVAAAAGASPSVTGRVVRVIDGDTIWVKVAADTKPLKVRIQSIDAPEICQDGGPGAKKALAARVLGQSVTLDPQAQDKYLRTIAKVDYQGEDLGRWLVSSGHAWATGYFQSAGPYAADQKNAQAARRGIFRTGSPEQPKDFRKRYGSCFAKP